MSRITGGIMETTFSWKDKLVVDSYLKGRRSAIPNASDQLKCMLHILRYNEKLVTKFIDLGAGDGIISQLILDQYCKAEGYLIDFSEPMINAAHKRLENYKDRVKILKADISKSDWQKQIFSSDKEVVDAIVSGYCIHHLTHGRKYELYEEIYKRLSPEGLFINIEHVASHSHWGEKLSNEAFVDSILQYEVGFENARTREQISIDFENREDKKDNILLSVETQCEWLKEIGFKDVDIFFKSFELTVFAGRKDSAKNR